MAATLTDVGVHEALAVAEVEVAREASTEATNHLAHFDTALARDRVPLGPEGPGHGGIKIATVVVAALRFFPRHLNRSAASSTPSVAVARLRSRIRQCRKHGWTTVRKAGRYGHSPEPAIDNGMLPTSDRRRE